MMIRRLARVIAAVLILPACGPGGGGAVPLLGPPGSLDPGFGTAGVVVGADGIARSLVIDAASMYVVGNEPPGGTRWRIEKRSLSTGALDPGFGTAGAVFSDPSVGLDHADAVALSGGSLYIVGSANSTDWRIEKRSAATGALDGVFGGGAGFINVSAGGGTLQPTAIAVDGADLYVVGFRYPPASADYEWLIEKRSATTGAFDGVFAGGSGVMILDFGTAQDEAHAIALDATSLYVAGLQHLAGGDYAWRIEKRDRATGALDGVFGGGTGALTINPSTNSYDDAQSIALSGSSLYIAGFHEFSGATDRVWRVEKRDATTGALDPVFGGATGFIESNPGTLNDQVGSVVVDGASLYVGGWFDTTALIDIAWRLEKRATASGAPDAAFGTAGAVVTDPGTQEDQLYDVAVDGTYVYAVGLQKEPGGYRWRIEKRVK